MAWRANDAFESDPVNQYLTDALPDTSSDSGA